MIRAYAIHEMVQRLEKRDFHTPAGQYIEITYRFLEQFNFSYEEAYSVLTLLSTRPGYKCIEFTHFTSPTISNDELEMIDVIAHIKLLPNFIDTRRALYKFFRYKRYPKGAIKRKPNEDWSVLERRFATNEPDIDWTAVYSEVEDKPIETLKLRPESYNKATGSLELKPGLALSIPRKGKVKKSTGEKYLECKVMEKLFHSQTTLSDGVSFHSLLGIHKDKQLTENDVKKVTNVRTAINKKISDETRLKKLIIISRKKAYINHLYLLKD